MKVLVIGGSGFIGTRLVDELLEKGHEVSIFDARISEKYPNLTQQGDVRSLQELRLATSDIDAVYNLAAEHRDDVAPLSLYHQVNVDGAKNIVIAAKAAQIKKIVFTSTVAIYGLNKDEPDEESPPEPFNEYGKTKLAAEAIFKAWEESDQSHKLTIVRPAVVFGEGNRGNVYNLMTQISNGRFVMIGNGQNKKSMGYVGNIADFLSLQLERADSSVFNFCDKPDLTSAEIASTIANGLGKTLPRFRLPLFMGTLAGHLLDMVKTLTGKQFPISAIRIKKFTAETTIDTHKLVDSGYSQKYSTREGIIRMVTSDFKCHRLCKTDRPSAL